MDAPVELFLADLQVFHGSVSPMRAEVYARVPTLQPGDGYRLEGQVSGPWSGSSRTLPARSPLRDAGPGPTLLARAVVPDPCPWTAEIPALYRVRVELYRETRLLGTADRTLGFRNLGTAGGRLFRSGQPWILRGLATGEQPEVAWEFFREADLAALVEEPAVELCQAAAELGVPLMVVTSAEGESLRRRVFRWSQAPAVAAVLAAGSQPWPVDPHAWAPNLLFASRWPVAAGESRPAAAAGDPQAAAAPLEPPGADLIVCGAEHRAAAGDAAARWRVPLLVSRRVARDAALAERYEALQQLERETAASGPPAGYVVECV